MFLPALTFALATFRPLTRCRRLSSRFLCATAAPTPFPSTPLPSPLTIIGGGGNMATALITGLKSLTPSSEIRASSPCLSHLSHLPLPPTSLFTDNIAASSSASLILLCVKPQIAPIVLSELKPLYQQNENPPPLLSIVAGLSTAQLEEHLGGSPPVIRAMPNLPAAHQAAVTALCGGQYATREHIDSARVAMSAVGTVVALPESQFGAFTAIAGSGVAYLFMVAEALADAAVANGLSRKIALAVAAETVRGAGECLRAGEHPAVLRNLVESPGGVTIAATGKLERGGLRGVVQEAVQEAIRKNEEMERGE